MHMNYGCLAVGLILIAAVSAQAEIIKGVMSVTGAEMSWWGGLVRDTIARRSDVEKNSVKFEIEPGTGRYRNGTITFSALKGESIDLQKLCENIKETRLGKGTRSKVNYLEITAEGEVVAADKDALLTVRDTAQQFTLGDDPKAKPEEGVKTPYQRLREALAKGEKIATVTGRVQGWSGVWPEVLRELATEPAKDMDKPGRKKPTLLFVTDFQTVKKWGHRRITMQGKRWCFAAALALLAGASANAEIIKGSMLVHGCEMSWWGGMARDAIARQYDVDADLTKLTPFKGQTGSYQLGTIEFFAKKGKSIDLDKLDGSIAATRLSGRTNMSIDYLEITAKGEVVERDKELVLKVSDTGQELVLSEEPTAKGGLQRLRRAVARGDKVSTVIGRVPGWSGRFPDVLAAWAKASDTQKRKLAVVDFEVEKK